MVDLLGCELVAEMDQLSSGQWACTLVCDWEKKMAARTAHATAEKRDSQKESAKVDC